MPQATDDLRQKWGGEGGVGEDKAIDHLTKRGYILTPKGQWFKPINIIMTNDDIEAVEFLWQEWDYGGIVMNK